MDGLRGVAMTAVFFCHFSALWLSLPASGPATLFLRFVGTNGSIGTDFFMLLSGFFAYNARMKANNTFPEFLSGRFRRIYPLYFLICLLYVGASLAAPELSRLPADPAAAVLYILGSFLMLPPLFGQRPIYDPTWTLSYIILFYFIEEAVARLFRWAGVSRRWRFILLCCATLAWAVISEKTALWPARTIVFWLGMALSEAVGAVRDHGPKWRNTALALALPCAVFCSGLWLISTFGGPGPASLPFPFDRLVSVPAGLMSFTVVAFFGPEWWKTALSWKYLRLLGAISYPYYMTHGFTVKLFRWVILPWLGATGSSQLLFWTSQAAGLIISVVVAFLVNISLDKQLAMNPRGSIRMLPDCSSCPRFICSGSSVCSGAPV